MIEVYLGTEKEIKLQVLLSQVCYKILIKIFHHFSAKVLGYCFMTGCLPDVNIPWECYS